MSEYEGKYNTVKEVYIDFQLEVTPKNEWGIRCQTCNMISFNPNDINNRYCCNCHKFHEIHREEGGNNEIK